MKTNNATIAETLRRYASVLSVQGADRFRLKAYRRAAETIESLDESVSELVSSGSDLTHLPGIGKAISDAITEIVRNGNLSRLDRASATIPTETLELSSRPRLDPKRVARVYKKLGIHSLKELEENLRSGKIREALGAPMEFHIRQGLDERPRHLLWSVRETAERIEKYLAELPAVSKVSATGSLRRKKETIGDLNFLVSGKSASAIFKAFQKFGPVQNVEKRGDTEAAFQLSSGVQVVLKWTKEPDWGVSLIEATGSSKHVEQLVNLAQKQHVSLTQTKGSSPFSDENSVYEALGISFVEPELREGRGEIAAALEGQLPVLVTAADLRGDLHMHTTASDGSNSIEEMAEAARELGYEYISITDHSQSLKITNGLNEKRLREQIEQIDQINSRLKGIRILKSSEVDILQDGSLDYPNSVLKQLDLTICSIHSKFSMNKTQQTERILRAMDNPYFNILGHATGRLLLHREGYELDIDRVVRHAKQAGCFFEINSSPNRLDLSDENAKLAKDAGILIAINTDAHSTRELRFIEAGINQARRAWLSKSEVLNCYPVKKLLQLLKR